MIYTVYGRWEQGSPLRPSDLEKVSAMFRPDVEGVCVWTEPDEPTVLRLSVELEAVSFEDALRLGQAALTEAATTASLPGGPIQVVAMTEEGQATWSA